MPSYRHLITGVSRADPPAETKGGILADDMGLGKTLTALSLILSTQNHAHIWLESPGSSVGPAGAPEVSRRIKATLIVCPLSCTPSCGVRLTCSWPIYLLTLAQ